MSYIIRTDKINNPKYQLILDAAAKVFKTHGYHHANISDIANEVGLQKGSLYYHITSKEELLYEIILSAANLYLESLQAVVDSKHKPDILLTKAIHAHMQPMDIHFDRCYVFLVEFNNLAKQHIKKVHIAMDKYLAIWIKILKQGISRGIFLPDLDCKMSALSILGMCNWTLNWYKVGGKYDTSDLADMYSAGILNGIKVKNKKTK